MVRHIGSTQRILSALVRPRPAFAARVRSSTSRCVSTTTSSTEVVPEVNRTKRRRRAGAELLRVVSRMKRNPFAPGFSSATVLPGCGAPMLSSRMAHKGACASISDNSSGFIWWWIGMITAPQPAPPARRSQTPGHSAHARPRLAFAHTLPLEFARAGFPLHAKVTRN